MVLAHSLRDAGTKGKLAVLITPDSLKPDTIEELRVSHAVVDTKNLLMGIDRLR